MIKDLKRRRFLSAPTNSPMLRATRNYRRVLMGIEVVDGISSVLVPDRINNPWPLARSSSVTAVPIQPEAPVTKTRLGDSFR